MLIGIHVSKTWLYSQDEVTPLFVAVTDFLICSEWLGLEVIVKYQASNWCSAKPVLLESERVF